MDHKPRKKFALPRGAAQLQQLEDRIDAILQRIKAIRQGLQGGPVQSVILKTGTFEHYLDLLEPLSLEYKSTYDNEVAMHAGREARAKLAARQKDTT